MIKQKFKIIPIGLKAANDFVEQFHRHNGRTSKNGGKFAIGLQSENKLVGVAICGRPLARLLDDNFTAEITRVCIIPDIIQNANSILYGRVRRILLLMGYERIITYTLQSESGISLKAAGFRIIDKINQRKKSWESRTDSPHIKRIYQPVYSEAKIRWQSK